MQKTRIQLPDLFPEETAIAQAEREAKEAQEAAKKKRRGMYHDRRGKFTDKTTAEIAAIEKQSKIYKNNYHYYKRVNKRLSREIKAEEERANMWEQKYNDLLNEFSLTKTA